ncbi:hypothetical protein HOU02_gp232 [Caulobacter phage CcrBL9]|uniref:Uncharacterized protein n=1 Tax=Caulobacter phage CcrBL9 TaxID=2283270 RepID=A0A385ECI9_9CAUD|nr:hypothetical protein HOU02_gp232 [Caulobacter phage CcrBL9]AXQ69493.1 hypothetical protein CcrBL9_gp469 [Caulobacter phage CcrBL9]
MGEDVERDLDVHGGFDWMVLSYAQTIFSHPVFVERFDTEEMAIFAGRQRLEEGYRHVDVVKQVAYSCMPWIED